jgi:chromosomal replication initiator protein
LGIRRKSDETSENLKTMNCSPQVWDGVLRRLGAEVPSFALDAWLRPLRAEPHAGGIRLLCPTPFHRERVRERFLARIEERLADEVGARLPIDLAVAAPREAAVEAAPPAAPTQAPDRAAAQAPDRAPAQARDRAPAQPRERAPACADAPAQTGPGGGAAADYTFESFGVGPSNALAREASFALAHDRQPGLSPLYLCADPGLGKTHLARALVREALLRGGRRVVYESAEGFTSRFTSAIRNRTMDAFKRRYREQCDLLVLEDVQFLSAKSATQIELFHTVTHLAGAGARLVLTGDRLPRDIHGLEARLRSQMSAGLVAQIEPPDAAVRRAILRAKAAGGGVRIPDDCLDLLVESVRGSVRDLEGALIQLVTTSSLLKRPIDLELTRSALHKLAPRLLTLRRLDVDTVLRVVAAHAGLSREALASKSRRGDVRLPRQIAMYLAHRYTGESFGAIGRAFDRKHSSVSNAVQRMERQMLERAPLRYRVEELSARLDRIREGVE